MRIARVIGTLTLGQAHPSYQGARLRLAIPLSQRELRGQQEPGGECLVVWDPWGAGEGDLIAISEGPAAAQPFRPQLKPVEAYNAAILDRVQLHPPDESQLTSAPDP